MRTEVLLETWEILQLVGMANFDRCNINFTRPIIDIIIVHQSRYSMSTSEKNSCKMRMELCLLEMVSNANIGQTILRNRVMLHIYTLFWRKHICWVC